MSTALAITRDEVAELLGIRPHAFDQRRAMLERDHGFPAKLPLLNRWSRAAVEAWASGPGLHQLAPAPPPAPASDDDHWAALLDKRAAALGSKAA